MIHTLHTVVSGVLLRLNKTDENQELGEKLLQYCIDGLREINIHFIPTNINVAYLTVSDLRTVSFPNGYVDYTKIGIEVGGRIWTLTLNENILLPRGEKCGQDIRKVVAGGGVYSDSTDVYYYADHIRNGNFVGGAYGVTGGFNKAYYRIDKQNRRIVFSSGIKSGSQIVLEYLSDGINLTGETFIPAQYINPLRLYCLWQLIEYTDAPNNIKRERERQFWQAVSMLETLETALTGDEWMDAAYSTYKQTPKR